MAVGKRERIKLDKNNNEIKNSTRYYSSKQEKKVANLFNGHQVKNSGATPWEKGDVDTNLFLLECKTHTTDKDSMSIKKIWLEKNNEEALFMGKKYSALVFNFGPSSKNYYIIDEYLMQELMNHLENLERNST